LKCGHNSLVDQRIGWGIPKFYIFDAPDKSHIIALRRRLTRIFSGDRVYNDMYIHKMSRRLYLNEYI
jgi:hypothetical protein